MSGIRVRVSLAVLGAVVAAGTAFAAGGHRELGPLRVAVLVPPAAMRDAGDVSEPHLAVDPGHPTTLVAVAQTRDLVAWRSEDGGVSWTSSRPLAGASGSGGYAGGDPVIARTYRSADGARSFGPLASPSETQRLPRHFFGVPPIPSCPLPKGLTHVATNDKPWVAIDTSSGPHRGSAYLVWSLNDQTVTGGTFATLLVAVSRDGGRTYGKPVVLSPRTSTPDTLEHYSQIAVRPDGTVDVVWNGLRKGHTAILHASSKDGGSSFGAPDTVYALPTSSTPLGLVTSLAVSPSGKLAVCWAASVRPKAYVPRVGCALSTTARRWTAAVSPFAGGGAQYLPAAAFEGDRLWVAAYRSTSGSTEVLLAGSSADGRGFDAAVVLARRPYGRVSLCAPHPPDCTPRQRFVGDYIGAAAVSGKVWVDFVLPTAGPATPKRVYVASLPTA
jgi:hypothetical protein